MIGCETLGEIISHCQVECSYNFIFRADLLTSRVIRHVMKVHEAKNKIFQSQLEADSRKKFLFPDIDDLVNNI